MTRSSPDANSRGRSEDTWSGKRTAEDDESPNLSEPQKRARRTASIPSTEEDHVRDFVVVPSQRDHLKSDTHTRPALSSQPSSPLSSPPLSANSRSTEDCGDMAAKAMQAWQNTLTPTKSDSSRQELLPGPSSTAHEVRTTMPPGSGDHSHSRDWLGASSQSAERQFRTPLPAQKELRLQPSPGEDNSPSRGDSFAQHSQPSGSRISDQPSDSSQRPGNERPINPDPFGPGATRITGHPEEYPRIVPQDFNPLSDRDAPVWYTGDERRLPPLPSIGAQYSNFGKDLPRPHEFQSPGPAPNAKGLEGGLNTFPSNFSVLTSEEIQRNQASGIKSGSRRRGKKPPGSAGMQGGERTVLANGIADVAQGNPQSEPFLSRHEIRPEEARPRSSPQFRDIVLQPIMNTTPISTANTTPLVHHTIQTGRPFTPPRSVNAQYASFQPPPVIFTLDNRAESSLPTLEVQPLVENFTQNTTAIVPTSNKEATSHPISVIMWQGLVDFYKWYGHVAKVQEIGPLMFELIDVHWQEEKSFVVPEGSLNYFRTIKQYIWDLYWLAVHINKGQSVFRVLITQFSPRGDVPPNRPDQWDPVNSRISDSTMRVHDSDQQTHVILESRPGPLYYQRHSSITSPSLPTTLPRTRPMISSRQHQEGPPMNQAVSRSSEPRRSSFSPGQLTNYEAGSQHNQRPPSSMSTSPQISHARTLRDQAMLRERAFAFLNGRPDLELLHHESTVLDKLPYKTGAEVCGVVIDRRSGKGMVAVTGKGYITLNVKTGPDEPGDAYQDVTIQPKQTCMLHGEVAVLFYRRRDQQPKQASPQQIPRFDNPPLRRPSIASDVDIAIRLQVDGSGRYSQAFDKSVLRPKISTTDFFSFFAHQSGHCVPQGPPYLKFTFKDAMPTPTSTEIVRGNEDHFNYMRKDIKMQCEKAKKYMTDLKEFVILVTVPGWTSPNEDEEEEW